MQSFPCDYCGDKRAIRFGGICSACSQEDRKLLREAHKILRSEGGISLEDMSIQLGITVCRVERWIKDKLIDLKLVNDLATGPVYAGTSNDRFLKREASGAFTREMVPSFLEKATKHRMATAHADRSRDRREEAA